MENSKKIWGLNDKIKFDYIKKWVDDSKWVRKENLRINSINFTKKIKNINTFYYNQNILL